jgi:hypothetical protein
MREEQDLVKCKHFDAGICQIGKAYTCEYQHGCKVPKEVAEPEDISIGELMKGVIKNVSAYYDTRTEVAVEKADLEKLIEYAEYRADLMEAGIKYDYNWWLKCQKKYLPEEEEKDE